MPRLEATMERELIRRAINGGGMAIKLVNYKGIPDRMVLMPRKQIFFAELKSDTGELSRAQEVWHYNLRALGFPVAVLSEYETLDLFLPR